VSQQLKILYLEIETIDKFVCDFLISRDIFGSLNLKGKISKWSIPQSVNFKLVSVSKIKRKWSKLKNE